MFLRHDYNRNVSLKSSKFVNTLKEHLYKNILILKCHVDQERFAENGLDLYCNILNSSLDWKAALS